jgi:hypothetical protein
MLLDCIFMGCQREHITSLLHKSKVLTQGSHIGSHVLLLCPFTGFLACHPMRYLLSLMLCAERSVLSVSALSDIQLPASYSQASIPAGDVSVSQSLDSFPTG